MPHTALPKKKTRFWKGSLVAIASLGAISQTQAAPLDDIWAECQYISQCSFSDVNFLQTDAQRTADGWGMLNDWRLGGVGLDFARVGEAAMAQVGLMYGTRKMEITWGDDYFDRWRHRYAIEHFFRDWIQEGPNADGGFPSQIYYDRRGRETERNSSNVAVTAQMLIAMWKFYEFSQDRQWLDQNYAMAHRAADFLGSKFNSNEKLLFDGNAWVSDNAFAVAGFRCFEAWARRSGNQGTANYFRDRANDIAGALWTFGDFGDWSNFKRYKQRGRNATYGGVIDQTCFTAFEADALPPGDPFSKKISDWWTTGRGWDNYRMTPYRGSSNRNNWRYYGTRWHMYDPNVIPRSDRWDRSYLFPGPGLQLAKVEYKYYRATGDTRYRNRALNRLAFARDKSNLWFRDTNNAEGGIAAGFNDWRNANNYNDEQPETFKRFIDTSAYFIQVTLMLRFNEDTTYIPDFSLWR